MSARTVLGEDEKPGFNVTLNQTGDGLTLTCGTCSTGSCSC